MISAFRTGQVAGSTLFHQFPSLDTSTHVKAAATVALTKRRRDGIAHCEPEQEFIQGFLAGYKSPFPLIDGLSLFSSLRL